MRVFKRCASLHSLWFTRRGQTPSGAEVLHLHHVQCGRVLAGAKHVVSLSCAPTVGRNTARWQPSPATRPTCANVWFPILRCVPRCDPPRHAVIGQVAKSLQCTVGKKVSSGERQMTHSKKQLHHLRVRIARQVEALRVHTEQSELMVAKLNVNLEP